MSIFEELEQLFLQLEIPSETVEFTDVPQPDTFAVFTPISDNLELYADDLPQIEIPSVRISVFSKHNYLVLVKRIKKTLLANDFYLTESRYVGYETATEYHHYAIDVEKDYKF